MMSHGLYTTAKAADVVLRQISFFILIALLIGFPFQMYFAALPTHPTAPVNSGLSYGNDEPLCLHLRIAETQPPSPLVRKTLLQRPPPAPQGERRP